MSLVLQIDRQAPLRFAAPDGGRELLPQPRIPRGSGVRRRQPPRYCARSAPWSWRRAARDATNRPSPRGRWRVANAPARSRVRPLWRARAQDVACVWSKT